MRNRAFDVCYLAFKLERNIYQNAYYSLEHLRRNFFGHAVRTLIFARAYHVRGNKLDAIYHRTLATDVLVLTKILYDLFFF